MTVITGINWCAVGVHRWGQWFHQQRNFGLQTWQERRCERCRITESRVLG